MTDLASAETCTCNCSMHIQHMPHCSMHAHFTTCNCSMHIQHMQLLQAHACTRSGSPHNVLHSPSNVLMCCTDSRARVRAIYPQRTILIAFIPMPYHKTPQPPHPSTVTAACEIALSGQYASEKDWSWHDVTNFGHRYSSSDLLRKLPSSR